MAKNKHKTSHTRHRPFYKHPLFFCFVIIILAAAGVYFLILKPQEPIPSDATDTKKINDQLADTAEESHSVTSNSTSDTSTTDSSVSPDGKTPEKYEGGNPNNAESLTGSITSARFSGDKLMIRINIDQYLSGGTCTLILSDGTNELRQSTNITPVVSTSSCEGFDVQNAEIANFSHPIDITVNLVSGEKTGVITGRAE